MFGMLKALRGGGPPLEILGAALQGIPAESQTQARELLDLMGGAAGNGIPDPPPWLAPLFQAAGRETGISPELLAAWSWTLSRFDPRDTGGTRVGLMGISRSSLADPAALSSSWEALQERQEAALRAVWFNVLSGARLLAAKRRHASLLEALAEVTSPGAVPTVIGAYVLFLARKVSTGRAQELQEVSRGE